MRGLLSEAIIFVVDYVPPLLPSTVLGMPPSATYTLLLDVTAEIIVPGLVEEPVPATPPVPLPPIAGAVLAPLLLLLSM